MIACRSTLWFYQPYHHQLFAFLYSVASTSSILRVRITALHPVDGLEALLSQMTEKEFLRCLHGLRDLDLICFGCVEHLSTPLVVNPKV